MTASQRVLGVLRFLCSRSGVAADDVLAHKMYAGILRPAYTVLHDRELKQVRAVCPPNPAVPILGVVRSSQLGRVPACSATPLSCCCTARGCLIPKRADGVWQVVLVVRGTHSMRDTLTCLVGESRPHHAYGDMHDDGPALIESHTGRTRQPVLGYAHGGMLAGARWLLDEVKEVLADAFQVRIPCRQAGKKSSEATRIVFLFAR